MSANKWTPGPWRAMGRTHVETTLGTMIADTCDNTLMHEAQCSNARLIAAAPDLAEALEEVMRVLSNLPSTNQEGPRTRNAWNKARAALAKARREE